MLLSEEWHWATELNWNYGGGNEENGDLPQKIPGMYCYGPCPQPCSRPPWTHAFARDSRTPTGKSGQSPVGSLFLSPGSWCTRFCCALREPISQSRVSSGSSMVGLMEISSKRAYALTPRERCNSKLEGKSETIISWLEKREIIIASWGLTQTSSVYSS